MLNKQNKLIKSSGKCNPKNKTYFLSCSVSGIVKTGRNTFYKYQDEPKICLPYIIKQASGFFIIKQGSVNR